ncbi:MAG: hypothetical protein VYA84_11980 [Planctomycetota bacterium]|nr:hypothetical protein [Planctomycetota bacterium]
MAGKCFTLECLRANRVAYTAKAVRIRGVDAAISAQTGDISVCTDRKEAGG